jgi:hypothetical protein
MMSGINEIIDAIVDGDTIEIQNHFNNEMSNRLSKVLDVYRAQVAQSLFGTREESSEENA